MSYTGIKYKQRSIGKMNDENNRHIWKDKGRLQRVWHRERGIS